MNPRTIGRFNSTWDRFFHSEADARVYAAIRIGVAICLLIHAGVLGGNWIQWFGEIGVIDSKSGLENIDSDTWSILNWLPGTPVTLWAILALFTLQASLLLIGFKSKFQVACLFILLLSFHHRNNLIWEGGDVLLRLTLFLMIVMPLGERWSVDALKRGSRKWSPIWPLRLLQLQQSLLYLSSIWRKLQGEDWINGHALYYASRLDEFSGRILTLKLSENYLWIYQLGSWLAVAIEALLVFAVWKASLKKQAIFIGIGFHLVLELSMNLFLFQWLMILILVTHLIDIRPASVTGRLNSLECCDGTGDNCQKPATNDHGR